MAGKGEKLLIAIVMSKAEWTTGGRMNDHRDVARHSLMIAVTANMLSTNAIMRDVLIMLMIRADRR